MRTISAVFVGLAALVTACSSTGDRPAAGASGSASPDTPTSVVGPAAATEQALRGIWVNDGFSGGYWATVLVRFDTDGGFAIGNTGRVDGGAYQTGAYEVVDGTVHFAAEDSRDCAGIDWVWDVQIADDGTMRSEVIGGRGCAPVGTIEGWIRVSPISKAGMELVAGDRDVEPRAPRNVLDLFGVWLRVGTGQILQIRLDGTYAIDEEGDLHASPIATGTITIEGDSLRFTISRNSVVCPLDQTWQWTGVALADDLVTPNRPRATTMRAVGSTEPCKKTPGETLIWRRLSRGER